MRLSASRSGVTWGALLILAVSELVVASAQCSAGEGSSAMDSLVARRDSLRSQLSETEESIARMRARAAELVVGEKGGWFVAKLTRDDAELIFSLDDLSARRPVDRATPVQIIGIDEMSNYVEVIAGGSRGYMEQLQFWGDPQTHAHLTELNALKVRNMEDRTIEAAREAVLKAERDAERARRARDRDARIQAGARRIDLVNRYGEAIGTRINDGEIWVGMTAEMVRDSLGPPLGVNSTITVRGRHEQWIYRGHVKYVYVENAFVTGWQE